MTRYIGLCGTERLDYLRDLARVLGQIKTIDQSSFDSLFAHMQVEIEKGRLVDSNGN